MKVLSLAGLAFALLFSASIAGAATPVRVALRPVPTGVEATFVLPAPAARFALEEEVEDVRADTWHVATPDLTLAKGVVSRPDGKPFDRFTVLITPDSRPRDRRYPALTRIGEGWQIYGPYFQSAQGQPPVEARTVAPKGWSVVPAAAGGRLRLAGYVYLGPPANVTAGAATFVAAPDVPPVMRTHLAKAASDAAAYYTRRLGVGLENRPTVIIALLPTFNRGWQGDTTEGPTASLRFFGPEAARFDESVAGPATHFVNHEFFHFWNSRGFKSRDGETEAWLHEGMAEYAALLTSRQAGSMSEVEVGEALGDRLTRCANMLGSKDLKTNPPRRGRAVYDCGVLVEWIADLKVRRASNGARDAFDLWRDLFKAAGRRGKTYDSAGFLALAGLSDQADEPLSLLMQPGDTGRWTRLSAALVGLGAQVSPSRSADAEREALVMHVLAQVCKGSRGFYGGDPKALKLDTQDHCGVLNGDPTIDAIAGHDIMSDIHAAFDAAVPLCAAGGEIALTLKGQAVATVTCKRPMPPRPMAWKVDRWR
ncbi:hypothetical protein [Caulobacter sp.]|uniref:M61 family metallopeptidase n=1 Tax=Caulobacter sp. TaxID=78 RepID=UPI003BA9BEFE